jgi:hypothetical protein
LQGRKKSGKSRFDEEKAAINLQLRSKHSCDTKKSNSPGAKKPRPPGAKKPPFRPPAQRKLAKADASYSISSLESTGGARWNFAQLFRTSLKHRFLLHVSQRLRSPVGYFGGGCGSCGW